MGWPGETTLTIIGPNQHTHARASTDSVRPDIKAIIDGAVDKLMNVRPETPSVKGTDFCTTAYRKTALPFP